MKPLIHSKISAKRHGGKPDDYMSIHEFFDGSKIAMANMKHRAILHNSFGCFLAEQVFGKYFTNSDGKQVSTRDIAEEHIIDDLGFIPDVSDWLKNMPLEPWMTGQRKRTRHEVS